MAERVRARYDAAKSVDKHGNTLLHIAALTTRPSKIERIFKAVDPQSITVDAVNEFGETALYLAVCQDNLCCVKRLLKHGADPNIAPLKATYPIHVASNNNNTEILQSLIDHGADVNRADRLGQTALSLAIRESTFEIVEILVKSGSSIGNFDLNSVFLFTSQPKWHELIIKKHLESETCVPIDVITRAYLKQSPVLDEIFARIERISYNRHNLGHFFRFSAKFTLSHWRNLCKFDDFMEQAAIYSLLFQLAARLVYRDINTEFIEIFYLLTRNSKLNQFLFLDKYAPEPEPIIHFLVFSGLLTNKSKQEIIKLSHHLIDNGLTIGITDVLVTHSVYGTCDFYRYLRDRCAISNDKYLQFLNKLPYTKRFRVETRLACDLLFTIDEILTTPLVCPVIIESALQFTVLPVFIKQIQQLDLATIKELLPQLPPVPSLKELTRNLIRDDFVRRYSLVGVADYCRIIRKLRLPKEIEEVLLFERKLYALEGRTVYRMCNNGRIDGAHMLYHCEIPHQ